MGAGGRTGVRGRERGGEVIGEDGKGRGRGGGLASHGGRGQGSGYLYGRPLWILLRLDLSQMTGR